MFRNLGNLFEKKKRLMGSYENSGIKITGVVELFLQDQFGHSIQNKLFNTSYNQKEGSLLVEAGNKILANELSLRLADLHSKLQEEKIKLNKILIR